MKDMIRIQDACKRYDAFELRDVSFSVKQDEIVGLIGSNGAGKTTVLKALLGLISLDSGTAEILGENLMSESPVVDVVKNDVGVVFDTCAFPSECRVGDVELIGRLVYRNWDRDLFDKLSGRFLLDINKQIKELSRGMGMKLTLAFALSHAPRVLLLDEATAGIDPLAREEVLDIMRDFMCDQNRAILLSTHITTDLEKIADRVICLDGGRIQFDMYKDSICDMAGIARCRESDLKTIEESGFLDEEKGCIRILRNSYGIDVLVRDRACFLRTFPQISCDKATIEDYMALVLKGDVL